MAARPRPPQRLSVEERVDHAVQGAVRRALAEQRRTQEKELDNLSDVLQRSLASLAGERDRALRSLAAEEDKRHELVEKLCSLLGEELTCGDVSRLLMGLERIEEEKEGGQEEDGERYGRAWVLEHLRQCLYARAAAQDHLRWAAEEVATDVFEAEELMEFEQAFSGRNAQHASPRPNTGGDAVGSEGVTRARAAASEALRTSVCLARERVEYLEKLALEVKGGAADENLRAAATGEHEARSRRSPSGVEVDRRQCYRGGVGGGDDGDESRSQTGKPADGSRSSERERAVGIEKAEARGTGSTCAGGDSEKGHSVAGGAGHASPSTADVAARLKRAATQEKRLEEAEARAEQRAAAAILARGSGGDQYAVSVKKLGGTSRGVALVARDRAGGSDLPGAELAEAKRWRMAARHAEASLADLRGTLGDVMALSFRCGQEHGQDGVRLEQGACSGGEGVKRDVAVAGGDGKVVAATASSRSLKGGSCGEGVGNEDKSRHQEKQSTLLLKKNQQPPQQQRRRRQSYGDAALVSSKPTPVAPRRGYGGAEIERPAMADSRMDAAGNSPDRDEVGSCCRRNPCPSCKARAAAVGVLLQRIEALSAEQGGDIARMSATLDVQRRRPEPKSPQPVAPPGGARARALSGNAGENGGGLSGSGARFKEDALPIRRGSAEAQIRAQAAVTGLVESDDEEEEKEEEEGEGGGAAARITEEAFGVSTSSSGSSSPSSAVTGRVAAKRRVSDASAAVEGGEGGGESLGDAADPKRDIRTEWEELEGLDTHLAHYRGGGGLGSLAVQGVLDRWIDVSKRRILEGWLAHVLHGGPVDAANGCFVPRVQMSSLSKEVRDGLVSVVLPLLLGRRGVLLQVLTRERVELVHDIQIRVTPVAGRRDAPSNSRGASMVRRRAPVGEREHGARIRNMVMKAAHAGYVEEDEGHGDDGAWRTPLASVDTLSRQLKDTWESFNANFAAVGEPRRGGGDRGRGGAVLPEY